MESINVTSTQWVSWGDARFLHAAAGSRRLLHRMPRPTPLGEQPAAQRQQGASRAAVQAEGVCLQSVLWCRDCMCSHTTFRLPGEPEPGTTTSHAQNAPGSSTPHS